MVAATLEVAGAAATFATETNSGELLARVDYSITDLQRVRDNLIAGVCLNIHDVAKANLTALGDYGVTAKRLTELKAKIDAYSGTISKPRTALSNGSATTRLLEAEFKAANKVLGKRLDRLMRQFQASEPEFYTAYKTSRRVVDNASGHNGKNGSNGSNGGNTP